MELDFEGLEMKHATDRAQRVDEKSGNICLVIMFTPRVRVFKMSEIANLFVFSADNSKKLVTVWAIYLNTPGRSYRVPAENGVVNRLWTCLFVRYCE